MKNNKLPNKKEWNDIINDAFSSDSEHRFSENYIQKKEKIKGGIIMKKTTFNPEKLFIGLTTAAVLAVVAIPTAAFTLKRAGTSDSPASHVSTENSSNTNITTSESEYRENTTASEAPTEIPNEAAEPMKLQYGDLPAGYSELNYDDTNDDFVVAPRDILINRNDNHTITADLYITSENYDFGTLDYSPSIKKPAPTETFRIDNKTVYLIRSLEPYYHTMITAFVRFDNSDYVAVVNANKTDCEDDVKEFIKSLFLTPAEPDTVMKTLTLPWANNGNANTKELPENGCPLGND